MNKGNEIQLTKMDWIKEQRTIVVANIDWSCYDNVYL